MPEAGCAQPAEDIQEKELGIFLHSGEGALIPILQGARDMDICLKRCFWIAL